jgi:hypothetical protein
MRGIARLALPALLAAGLTIMTAGPALAAIPTNDDFANATVVPGLPFTDAVNTAEATTQASDPTNCIGAAHSVWYTYTADSDGSVSFDTLGSDFDTVVSAYTGTEGSLSQIGCNDDADEGVLQSRVLFAVTAGTQYSIMVAGCCGTTEGDSGNLVVNADVGGPPFTFNVSFSSGSVEPKTGLATIHGTHVCSGPGLVDIAGELQERNGHTLVRGLFSVQVDCSQNMSTFTATVTPSNGGFVPGKASIVDVSVSGCGANGCASEFLQGVVTTLKLLP